MGVAVERGTMSLVFFFFLFNVIYLIVSLYNLIFIMAVFNSWIVEFLKT